MKDPFSEDFAGSLLRQRLARFPKGPIGSDRGGVPAISIRTSDSDIPIPEDEGGGPDVAEWDAARTASHRLVTPDGEFWFSGNSLLCRCPDCGAPMTVRLWLGLADCWRCEASIGLSEVQLRELKQLEKERAASVPAAAPVAVPTAAPRPSEVPVIDPEPEPLDAREAELEQLTQQSLLARFVRRGFSLTPAWLVSFLLHLIAILILAMILLDRDSVLPPTISLSTFLDKSRTEGGEIRVVDPADELQDDVPLPSEMEMEDEELRAIVQEANEDARELIEDPLPTAPLPDLDEVRKNVTTRQGPSMSFAARDPRVRTEIVYKEGGTTLTEAAVARGLRWLASVQNSDGSWSLKNFDDHDDPRNRGDALGTSLALLPFLGAGQTHEYGIYKETVAKGLAWLIREQKPNGDLRAGFSAQAGIYAHGQGAIVLCEALAMTGDEQFRQPAQKAIDFIESWQHEDGGWRYRRRQRGDTSVLGWQLMALQSARAPYTGLSVQPSSLKLADYFLDQVAVRKNDEGLPRGALYAYQPGRPATPVMTAEALLCRIYLGWKKDDPRLVSAVRWLVREHLPDIEDMNLYYWYYGTQVMHHFGGREWEKWNREMRAILVATQSTRGRHPGSWAPDPFEWGDSGGRIYTTSLAVCTLEVYYRHLPLFKQIDLE